MTAYQTVAIVNTSARGAGFGRTCAVFTENLVGLKLVRADVYKSDLAKSRVGGVAVVHSGVAGKIGVRRGVCISRIDTGRSTLEVQICRRGIDKERVLVNVACAFVSSFNIGVANRYYAAFLVIDLSPFISPDNAVCDERGAVGMAKNPTTDS